MSKKLMLTNLVYGEVYTDLFLENHLKSLLDQSNLPAHADRIEYILFTDLPSAKVIEAHPRWQALAKLVPTDIIQMTPDGFNGRYGELAVMFRESVKIAINEGFYLAAWVADLIVAKGFFDKIFMRLDHGADSVFVMPLRAAATGVRNTLQKALQGAVGALDPVDLCMLGYDNMHPLWTHCHWRNPQFTDQPYSLLWNSGGGLLVRTFSITPIAFTPYPEMLNITGGIDGDVPSLCRRPYWATDWVEAPVILAEPLECFYPTFSNLPASPAHIAKEFAKRLHPSQLANLTKLLYYPSKEVVFRDPAFEDQAIEANKVLVEISKELT